MTDEQLQAQFDRMAGYIIDLKREVVARLDLIEQRQSVMAATLTSLDMRMPPLAKSVMDVQASANQILKDRMDSDLDRRVSALEDEIARLKKAS